MKKTFRIEAVETVATRHGWNVIVEGNADMTDGDWREAAIDAFHEGDRKLVRENLEQEVIDLDVCDGPILIEESDA